MNGRIPLDWLNRLGGVGERSKCVCVSVEDLGDFSEDDLDNVISKDSRFKLEREWQRVWIP